jgi:hypothetical protein
MASKHRWYQAWEYQKHQQKSPLQIFREYNHMYGSWGQDEIHPVKPEWFEGYDRAGIDFRSLKTEPVTWWDREVLGMLRENGPEHFRKIALWDKDWNAVAHVFGMNGIDLSDPRSVGEKMAHCLLRATQQRRSNWGARALERFLRVQGW